MGFHGQALRAYSLTDQEDKAIFFVKIVFFEIFFNHSSFATPLSGHAPPGEELE